ncbi:ATPase AAA [Spirochaetia bacterium]|nr:ATPase AAA [Spirochaetia bacterium]
MAKLHYVEIENFKTFGKKIHIDLSHPTVLIGPNNSGKTSVIQAITLWSQGVKSWFEKKGDSNKIKTRERYAAGINRLNILEVPVAETRFFWNERKVRQDKNNVYIIINMGIEYNGCVHDCRLEFSYRDSEVIYCKPDEATMGNIELIQYASSIQFNLLYPMSGIMANISADTEETLFTDGHIKLLLGQGQTAQVLRNVCYKVVEADKTNGINEWEKIADVMHRIFLITINPPELNTNKGNLMLTYKTDNTETVLDISLAGRGLQQVLLILAYLYWHKGSVVLIDEPDAHLETLRQKQVYAILRTIAQENNGQVVIATHSEAILDDAVDINLTLLLDGTAENLAEKKDVRNALRTYGIEHYYKAKVHPRILYIEGSTDVEMIKSLAKHTKNENAARILNDRLNAYYTQNVNPHDDLENMFEQIGGSFLNYKGHFNALKKFIPELKGFALFDSDNIKKEDILETELAVVYWKHYEAENYFISPKVLVDFAKIQLDSNAGSLFLQNNVILFEQVIDVVMLESFFNNDSEQLTGYKNMVPALQRNYLSTKKMSDFAEEVFRRYAEKSGQPMLLTKGEFYRLVPYCPVQEIPKEVTEKLDLLVQYLGEL